MTKPFFDIKPDVLVFTHDHIDHYDPETVKRFITADSGITVLSPRSVWEKVRLFGGNNNYVCFNRHTSWTEKEVIFTAVKAEHSDPYAIGVVMDTGKYRYYVTGSELIVDGGMASQLYPDYLNILIRKEK